MAENTFKIVFQNQKLYHFVGGGLHILNHFSDNHICAIKF